jgi:hypothetical protein
VILNQRRCRLPCPSHPSAQSIVESYKSAFTAHVESPSLRNLESLVFAKVSINRL